MLSYGAFFFAIAVLAHLLGSDLAAEMAATLAKVCFAIFLLMFLASMIRRRRLPAEVGVVAGPARARAGVHSPARSPSP